MFHDLAGEVKPDAYAGLAGSTGTAVFCEPVEQAISNHWLKADTAILDVVKGLFVFVIYRKGYLPARVRKLYCIARQVFLYLCK